MESPSCFRTSGKPTEQMSQAQIDTDAGNATNPHTGNRTMAGAANRGILGAFHAKG
jgi:hypothetical protein